MVALTCYRIREDTGTRSIDDFDDAVDLEDHSPEIFGPVAGDRFSAKAYVLRPVPRVVPWSSLLETGFGGLSLSAQNIFDKFYIDYSSDTRLPTDNLSYFAGRGRTVTLAWDWRF